MSLVTVIKDYFEIVHKVIETSPAYIVEHTTYTDTTTLYFYLINTFKNLFTDLFSLDFLKKIAGFPIIVPNIADSMISEVSVLDGTFHNLFTFLDAPISSAKNDFIFVVCLEKLFIGLFNSIFLWLPTSAATFLCLRRFVMQGMEIGYIAAIGTMTANIFWLFCVLFGIRSIVIPWMSLDVLRYWLGFMLLIKYFWDNRLPAKEIKSDLSLNLKSIFGVKSVISIFAQSFQFHKNNPIRQVFFFHFLLAFTEQTTLYPFLSHFSISAQSTYLESFPSNNFVNFILINSFYLFGIFIGSFSFINLICWFWEEPAYKVYLWATKNVQKMRVGDMVRITHFVFQTLTILLACASLPYFSIEYFITKPLGFLPNDQIFHQSQNHAFLTHSTSPVLYRSPYYFPRQRFFRYDDWAEYYGKNIPLDTSLYDQGAYRLFAMEDLHFGADYEWTRRRSNHVKIRSRMKRIMWFPRNWATQIWDLAKTWSRRNVAWRNEILSQYQNNWDSKSAPFWEQIVREDIVYGKEKQKNELKNQSPWAASQNWNQKFLISGEGFWWNWWSKNTNSDNKIWWNWIHTKKKQIILNNNNNNFFISEKTNFNEITPRNAKNNEESNDQLWNKFSQSITPKTIHPKINFSNYQKLPLSYRMDSWIPQERLISFYSEQNKRQKNELIYEIATLRKFVRKINKRVQINFNKQKFHSPLDTIFSIQNVLLQNKRDNLIQNSKKLMKSSLNDYSLINQPSKFNKFNSIGMNNVNANANNGIDLSKKNNLFLGKPDRPFIESSSLFLTLPAHYYLHTEQSFSRKLQFYGVRTSRELKPLNNAPIFNYYMKTYFHQYKPTRLFIANTKMKRDLGAGGRNRFKSRQYANKQLKKARILSKTPWIRQWISQSGFLTRRKRLESWIRYSHYNSNEIWALILRTDIDNFIKRQPNSHLLTNNEERLLHLRRFLLGEHFETLRWYSYMQHYRSMKVKIGGTKSFLNRMYNQQFKGTFHKVRHLFALTPSLNGGGMLTFDQLLYNEFPNDTKNSIFNKNFIHEELLSDKIPNINTFLVKNKKTQDLNLNFYSNDLIMKFSDIIKNYILEITPNHQQSIQKLIKEKNYVDLTNLLWLSEIRYNKNFLINNITKKNQNNGKSIQEKSIRPSFSIDQQKKYQSMLILMFNKRRLLAKDYKRGSERLWKKWRKNFLIEKQKLKENNNFRLGNDQSLLFANIINSPSFYHNSSIEQKQSDISGTDNKIKKINLDYKDLSLFNQENTDLLSYQKQATIRKALKDSISIQQNYFNKKIDSPQMNVEKMLQHTKQNLQSKLFSSDKKIIKEITTKIYKKIQVFNKLQLKHFSLDYWSKQKINRNNKNWKVFFHTKNPLKKISTDNKLLNKNTQQALNVLSYLQNKIIRERLTINKSILNLKNYNQIDNKFFMIRASRHLKRARISQRKKLSQPVQKYKNFFHIENRNIKKLNVFKIYETVDSSILRFFDLSKRKLSSIDSGLKNSLLHSALNNKPYPNNINNILESSNIELINQNKKKDILNNLSFYNSNIFNIFQPFLESLYSLPRLSLIWQSNLINVNNKSKIDMGSIYETKQFLTPLGNHKQLFRQNFNTKNKIPDNIKRKLLDNHLNRFSERRRWNNQYQTINLEINEQLKKFFEIIKENQMIDFKNKKNLNKTLLFNSNIEKNKLMDILFFKDSGLLYPTQKKIKFFSLPLQKSIQNLNIKEIDQLQLIASIIDEKNAKPSTMNFSLLSLFDLNYLFNKFNKKNKINFDQSERMNYRFWNNNISYSNIPNYYYSKINELITNNDFTNKFMGDDFLGTLNKELLDLNKLKNFRFIDYLERKRDNIIGTKKNLIFRSINDLEKIYTTKNTSYEKKRDHQVLIFPSQDQTLKLSKNIESFLIRKIERKIENQLRKLENRLDLLNIKENQQERKSEKLDLAFTNVIEKQKKLITKRIEFLTNFKSQLKTFEIRFPQSLPLSSTEYNDKIENNNLRQRKSFYSFKLKKEQDPLSKTALNSLVENFTNFSQYLNIRKVIDFKNKNDEKPNGSNFENKKTIIEFARNFKNQKLLKKYFIQNVIKDHSNFNKFVERNEGYLKSQTSNNELISSSSVDSSIINYLLKKHKLKQFEETLGTVLAIQKRGNPISQKNSYYTKYRHEWNKKKDNKFSKPVSKLFKFRFSDFRRFTINNGKTLHFQNPTIRSAISNFLSIRTWTRFKQYFNQIPTPMNEKLLKHQANVNSSNSILFMDKITRQHFLTVENFIKESILKPQRFEKQQSRKRLKFKKLSRQENFKNLQGWENSFKQKEDMKNKSFFDDLSLSFQKWKNFGFFSQKEIFQKEINNFSMKFNTVPGFSTYIDRKTRKKQKKFENFYDTNFKTITNLDIIQQIEYDSLIQKQLNLLLNNELNETKVYSNIILNKHKQTLQLENNANPFISSMTKEIQEDSKYALKNQDSTVLNIPLLFSNKEETDAMDGNIIGKIYEQFFVKSPQTLIDKSQLSQKNFIGINTFPFYAGWDESLRKFVITNRLLSRRDAGYNSNIIINKNKQTSNEFNMEFKQWPLQGRNAATTFFCHFPFINQPSDFSETIQYRNRTQFQQEELSPPPFFEKENVKPNGLNSIKFLEKNQNISIKRLKKQKQEFRNENRRNITNLVGPNEIQNRRKALFYPLKWRNLKSTTKKMVLKLPLNKIKNNISSSNKIKDNINILSNFNLLKEQNNNFNYIEPLFSKFQLLRILRKGNTSKIRLTKIRPYKKYIKKENDILESPWRTFLSKRKSRSYNFVRQKNIRAMYLFQSQLGKRLQSTKIQWLFRKNNSRANRQSENRKNKSGAHYLRPRKKSLRRRSLGIKYKQNEKIYSLNNLYIKQLDLNSLEKNKKQINNRMMALKVKRDEETTVYNLNKLKKELQSGVPFNDNDIQKQIKFYQTPLNWNRPIYSNNLYNLLFKTQYIYTPTLYSTLPGHGRFLPKQQTMPLPKSLVQTIKRAVRLANFEPASFIQREVLSYEWSMKQLIRNMTSRLNNSGNQFILKNDTNANNSDSLIKRHLRLFKKKLIQNPVFSNNIYLGQFLRQRTFQKRSIRLRKFNMTLAMNLYDRWFFYYYTGGREDPLQNLFQSFGKLTNNLSNPDNMKLNQSNVLDNSNATMENPETVKKHPIFKSIRKFLTQKPDQKRSFNTFLTNLRTKKSSSSSKTLSSSNQEQKSLNYPNFINTDSSQDQNTRSISLQASINDKLSASNPVPDDNYQSWHLFKFFPNTIDGQVAQKEMLAKISSTKKQKKQQEKDLEEDRFYFLKANKSPIIQDFRSSKSVNRHYPLNGGFIWPGDYLRLQTIMLPKEKKYKYFYNKNLLSDMKNLEKLETKTLQTSDKKSIGYSNTKIDDKIKEFQNFILESK